MNSLNLENRRPASFGGIIWSAWLAILVAGLNLYATVDDSPFAAAMQLHPLLRDCWLGIQVGAVMTAIAIGIGGIPFVWAMLRHAIAKGRIDILRRLAVPLCALLALLAWGSAILMLTRGQWAPSPWAMAISQPDWPPEAFRRITGSVSACLLFFAIVASAISVVQALRRSEFSEVRLSVPGIDVQIEPLRLAGVLTPFVGVGALVMFVSVLAWGFLAKRYAGGAFADHFGPFGMTSFASWAGSAILFSAGAIACSISAWRVFRIQSA